MTVKHLSKTKKTVNGILVTSIVLIFLPLIILFFLLFLELAGNGVSLAIIIVSLVGLSIFIIVGLFSLAFRNRIFLKPGLKIHLEINTDKDLSRIRKKTEIDYSGNYLTTEDGNRRIEVDNSVAFDLLKENVDQIRSKKAVKRKTIFFESSPKAVLSDFLTSMGSLQ